MLIVSGTVGMGKTTLLGALSDALRERGEPHLAMDVDALSYTHPRPADDPFGQRIALANLAAVWANAVTAGATRAVMARVVEERAELPGYRSAIPGSAVIVVRLTAPPAVVAARLRGRERGAGLDWHLARAGELDAILDAHGPADLTIADDGTRTPPELATAVLERIGW